MITKSNAVVWATAAVFLTLAFVLPCVLERLDGAGEEPYNEGGA